MKNIRRMAVAGLQCGGFLLALAPSVAFAAAPNVTVSYEPLESGSIRVHTMAPTTLHDASTYQLSLAWAMTNNQATAVTMSHLDIAFPSSAVAPVSIPGSLAIGAGPGTVNQSNFTTADNLILSDPLPASIQLSLFFTGYTTPVTVTLPLAPYVAPTPSGSARFWGRVGDLRPQEYWQAMGAIHSPSAQGCQLFAHDVGVFGWNGSTYTELLPGTDGSQNEHYRQWGKPVFAMAAGTVKAFANNVPTNTIPIQNTLQGSGNSFVIADTSYSISYAHMQPGSLNPALLSLGATVTEGQFLGLLGNSGASPKPHLHVGAIKSDATTAALWGSTVCGGPLRPLPLNSAHAVDLTTLIGIQNFAGGAPWSLMDGEGVPNGASGVNSLIWPASSWPVNVLHNAVLSDFALGINGQLWTVESTGPIRTTSDRLSSAYNTGVFLDVDPTGSAKAIAYSASIPYIIGSDNFVRRGTTSGWVLTTLAAKRIAVDNWTGKVWGIGLDSAIYTFDPSTLAWSAAVPTTVRAKEIAVAASTTYVVGLDDHPYKGSGGVYTQLSSTATLKRISIDGNSGKLWGIGMDDRVYWSLTGSTWTQYSATATAKEVRVFDGLPYILGMDGGVWKGTGSNFARINVVEP